MDCDHIEPTADPRRSASDEALLRDALLWVRHWQADVACGLKPTISSLARMEGRLAEALRRRAPARTEAE